MKITIDTKEDSPEEIKKAIKMLSSLVEGETSTNQGNIFEKSGSDLGTTDQTIFDIFDDKNQVEAEEEKEEGTNVKIPKVEEYT